MGFKRYPVLLGVKGRVGGLISYLLNIDAQRRNEDNTVKLRVFLRETGTQGGVVKCVDTLGNTSGEGESLEDN